MRRFKFISIIFNSFLAGTIYDTSVYINALRRRDLSVFAQTRISSETNESKPLYLSAVVLEELYVGAGSQKLKKMLARYENNFEKINRLLVPNQTDWTSGGQILSHIGRKHGFELVRRARMTNDCLIAMTAARQGLTVITHNAADFQIIAEFRRFKWKEIKN